MFHEWVVEYTARSAPLAHLNVPRSFGQLQNRRYSSYLLDTAKSMGCKVCPNTTKLHIFLSKSVEKRMYCGLLLAMEGLTGFWIFAIVLVTKGITHRFEEWDLSSSSGGGGINTHKNKEQKEEKEGKKRVQTYPKAAWSPV
ncbi:hypothetical protein J6590_065939 [Homalodisca vitripennis]|nr:hypothetical protein J6590_065939 [Homalodisca vitripennis]